MGPRSPTTTASTGITGSTGRITAATRLLGVVGWPIGHSLSPVIQNAALRAAGLDAVYLALPVEPASLERAVRGLAAAGARGLNCTLPHKEAALALCDEASDIARAIGAVNTLWFEEGAIHGDNTDARGYVESLRHDAPQGGFDLSGREVVQLGAGGAGRAMAFGALAAGVDRLTLVNRTRETAEVLARALAARHPEARVRTLSPDEDAEQVGAALETAELVANATSLGLAESDPLPCDPKRLSPTTLAFDAVYRDGGTTPWLEAAAARGCPVLDGLGMLVRQGAAAFALWTGVEPDLDVMFGALRDRR